MSNLLNALIHSLIGMPPRLRVAMLLGFDGVLVAVVAYVVLALRLGTWVPEVAFGADAWYLPAVLLATLPIFLAFRLYQALVRYGGQWVLMLVARAVTVATLVLVPVTLVLRSPAFPLSVLPLLWGGLLLALMTSRLLLYWVIKSALDVDRRRDRERIAIYGAGRAGVQLLAALRSSLSHKVVALIDDDRALNGRHILGCTIHSPERLDDLIAELGIERVVVAVPSATAEQRKKILDRLAQVPVKVQTLPPLSEIIDCRVTVSQIRDILPEELLWRTPVAPLPDLLHHDVAGRSVMVTGGGGSIGSELCRQILDLSPSRLVVVENSELALYEIESRLRQSLPAEGAPELVFVLGSVCDRPFMQSVMAAQRVETVYHAAAYKHVPIVEHNPLAGIATNVLGTQRTAQAALDAGVGKFVLISTDKAVRPTSIMGASKRLAEMILQALAGRGPTVFAMVRFGNVINSTGSVVPLFRRQIAAGGPVTVTHKDVVRFFMTIPEAANLVLQAGALAEGGDVFLLDMGEPVRIYDLAVRLIHLSGYTVRDADNPQGDIPIVITGLRPGEKLYEEMFIGEDSRPTVHPRILKANEQHLRWEELKPRLAELEDAVARCEEARALAILKAAVPIHPEPLSWAIVNGQLGRTATSAGE